MRRLVPLLFTLAVVAAACAPELSGPRAPIAREQVPTAPALASASARRTVLAFVDAYASSPLDGGARLADLVAGDELGRWVAWLGVQDAQFPGRIEGRAEVRDVAFIGTTPIDRATGAEVDLGATVNFTFSPTGATAFGRARSLDGRVTLVSARPGDWRVVDVTRDGVPMSDGIQLFHDEVRTDGDVAVRLDSLFTFTPNWQFNVVVENRTRGDLALDARATGLYVRRPGGGFDRVEGVPAAGLLRVPAGTGSESLISYPEQDTADGRVLVLTFREGRRTFRVDFPLGDLVTVAPPPAPTTTADGGRTTG
ncbi:MAG: hypothetical protein ACM3WR_12105 [Solirubrobacterales bacterium]